MFRTWPRKSPYLRTERRLADIIAAIQATGTYKFYKLDFAAWAERITGDASQADHWKAVFEDHPEFFRLNNERDRASLVIRRQRQKLYDVDSETVVSKATVDQLPAHRVSRVPLTPGETETLVNVAVALHAAALGRQQAKRWWIPLIAAFFGALAGGLIPRLIPIDDTLLRSPPSQSLERK